MHVFVEFKDHSALRYVGSYIAEQQVDNVIKDFLESCAREALRWSQMAAAESPQAECSHPITGCKRKRGQLNQFVCEKCKAVVRAIDEEEIAQQA